MSEPLSIGMCAQAACILDATTFKPGNVSVYSGFGDMTAVDLLLSAAAIAPILEQAPIRPVGQTILECVRATRRVTRVNTNLGIILLFAPLASVQPGLDLRGGLMRTLMRLDIADARAAYEAIRLAKPGGLGDMPEQDVAAEPTVTLREAMALASGRDLVARQYINDFEQVFEGARILGVEASLRPDDCRSAVSVCFMELLARFPDSLIARKLGLAEAQLVSSEARDHLDHFRTAGRFTPSLLTDFDARLRGDRNARNPGTTADLVTASLFVALRQNIIQLPLPLPVKPA